MLLSIGVLTYNQSAFIRQCLDSILMQEINFDYEIVVSDDCSTDGTQDILKEYQIKYSEIIILLLHDRNRGISENYYSLFSKCKGKYIALCEGDDYWTDNQKMQLQVDFLETHSDYGFVGTYNQLLFPDGALKADKYDYLPLPIMEGKWEKYGSVFEFAKHGPVTRTVSICFRRSLIEPYMEYIGIGNDMILQTILAKQSFFAKYSESMCVYRQGGISTDNWDVNKQLMYNKWYVENRLLQKKLFPKECNWREDELQDRGTYILLKNAIRLRQLHNALKYKTQLKSPTYKRKKYSKYLLGPVSCLLLSLPLWNK